MIKSLINKKHLYYGASIIIGRGLEYFVLLFAAHTLSKSDYGELEYYKKIIEVGSSFLAFGFPILILSYTRSKESKKYFYLLSIASIFFIATIASIFMGAFNILFLLIPFLFYSLFFTGSVTQTYLLVSRGSNVASSYKTIISILFYLVIFCSIYFFSVGGYAYVYVNYILFPLFFIYAGYILYKQKIIWRKVKHYWRLFRKLLYGSFTLVVSDFSNMMFLYTDIFIIKLFSGQANIDIANYSFALNIGNMLLLIPMTLVQVDIEKLKSNFDFVKTLNKRISALLAISSVGIIILFYILVTYFIPEYKDVFGLFLVILVAKFIQAFSPLYGTMLNILKMYNTNLIINLVTLAINIVLSYLLFGGYGLYGVAVASIISLIIRHILLYKAFYKNIKQ